MEPIQSVRNAGQCRNSQETHLRSVCGTTGTAMARAVAIVARDARSPGALNGAEQVHIHVPGSQGAGRETSQRTMGGDPVGKGQQAIQS